MLDKGGNCDTKESINLIKLYLDWFGKESIDILLADKTFVGANWLAFLDGNKIRY
jgi:hypothetical protein